MAFITLQNLRSPVLVTGSSLPPVMKLIQPLGAEQTGLLLRHFASEQNRHYMYLWAEFQVVIAFALGACLFLATQRRIFPMILCGLMLAMVLFELRLIPELTYLGRETDFPPGSTSVGLGQRVWALQQVYGGVEIVKLLAGGILASYLFVFRTSRRSRKETATAVNR
jgi:hypothetical protein